MENGRRGLPYHRFGGLRLDQPLGEVSAEEAIALLDVDWADRNPGILRQRLGATKLKAAEATGLYSAIFRSTPLRLLALKNTSPKKLVAIDKTGAELAEIEWPVQVSCSFANFGTPSTVSVYAFRGSTSVVKFDGASGLSTPTASLNGVAGKTMPPIRYGAAWPGGGNRLVVSLSGGSWTGAGIGGESYVVFSDPGNAESWHTVAPEANYVQLTPGDNERITGICEWNDMIFVTKESRLFVFYGVATDNEGAAEFRYRIVELGSRVLNPTDVGSVARPTSVPIMAAGDEGVYILTQAGVMLTTGSRPVLISGALEALANEAPVAGPMNALLGGIDRWSKCRGLVYFNRRLYVLGGEPEVAGGRTFVYDVGRDSWLVWTAAMGAMVPWEVGGTEKQLVFSGKALKFIFVYSENVLSDPAAAIDASWQSGFYNLGIEDEKTLVEAKLYGNGTVTLSSFKDFQSTPGFSKAVTGFDPVTLGSGYVRASQTGSLFSHKLELDLNGAAVSPTVQRVVRYLRETRAGETETGAQ